MTRKGKHVTNLNSSQPSQTINTNQHCRATSTDPPS